MKHFLILKTQGKPKKNLFSVTTVINYNTGNDRAHFDQYKAKTFEKNEAFEI